VKIAVLSDTRLPTRWDYPGHGLGKTVLTVAEGLALLATGLRHQVTLFAGPGSQFDGGVIIADDERDYLGLLEGSSFDVVLDSTHRHDLQKHLQMPVVNWSQDREAPPGKCAVFSSKAHRDWHKSTTGRVIYNGVKLPDLPEIGDVEDYFLYVSMFHAPKGPVMAWNAARLAGVRLLMAGPSHPAPPAGVEYVGPVSGSVKMLLMAKAKALIFPASTEAGPVTPLEAQAVGTPVICVGYGAAPENVHSGWTASDTLEMARCIRQVVEMDDTAYRFLRCMTKTWVKNERSVAGMVGRFEGALLDAAAGKVW
jgi:glycosyltransferase involved in cell wall biosynthesis